MPLGFIKSTTVRDFLLVLFEMTVKVKKHLKCTEYDKFKCHAHCHTEGENIVKLSVHNHVPDVAKVE